MNFITGFIFYDLAFLVLFTIGVILFLVQNKEKLGREGPIFIYRTKVGVKIINYIGSKYKKILKFLSYFIVLVGYALMLFFTYHLIRVVYYYLVYPQITEIIKAPPLMLLIPYFPTIFGVSDLFPEFYFTYFLAAIIIVALVHEGFHGVYMRLNKVKIKSTGFGFLGPILAFFVEPEEKQLEKIKVFPQLSILAAGVFANIVTGIIFLLLFFLMFNTAYAPYGVAIAGYSGFVASGDTLQQGVLGNETISIDGINVTQITLNNRSYFIDKEVLGNEQVVFYHDLGAIRSGMRGIIIEINNVPTTTTTELRTEIDKYDIGETITIKTDYENNIQEYELELGESYEVADYKVLGIGVGENPLWVFRIIEWFKETGVVYKAKSLPELTNFFYYLFGWIVLINFLVALFNMLPIAIFDGGRFFYLTVLGITKSQKIAQKVFKFVSSFLLLLVLAMMIIWVFRIAF